MTCGEAQRNQAMTGCLNMPGLYLLLKMHFARQNYRLSAEEVLRAYVDVMHYGPQAQMIHEKRAHIHVI